MAIVPAQSAVAKVTVLANRTVQSIVVEVLCQGKPSERLTIASGDSQPVFYQRSMQVRFGEGVERQQHILKAGSVYFFTRGIEGRSLEIEQIGLGEQETPQQSAVPPLQPEKPLQPVTIGVKLLVDDNEPTYRSIWEPKLRKRIADASEIIERHTGVRFEVVEVGTWESDDEQLNFLRSMREFEQKVKVKPAQVAIGFSSQYQATHGRSHLGVTRWPMHTHILLRERSRNLLEAERLELLVHELGHYFGASHSPEPQSVMRPMLTRGPQRRVGSRVQFDPVNALIVAMMGEEMRKNNVRQIRGISKPTIERLKQIYSILQQAMPSDPAARQYLRILEMISAPPRVAQPDNRSRLHSPLVQDTRKILEHLQKVALKQSENEANKAQEFTDDELTNLYVQQAAQAATRVRASNSKRALLLALGIFFDDTQTLRSIPGTSDFIKLVDPEEQRLERIEVMGTPTMREREDLVKHFFASSHLVVAGGEPATADAGLAKEMLDAQGGSGFSFVDLAANHAGIIFAEKLLDETVSLIDVAKGFHVDDYLPTLVGLGEGLTAVDLKIQYGGPGQSTIASEIELLKQRVLDLPVYDQVTD